MMEINGRGVKLYCSACWAGCSTDRVAQSELPLAVTYAAEQYKNRHTKRETDNCASTMKPRVVEEARCRCFQIRRRRPFGAKQQLLNAQRQRGQVLDGIEEEPNLQ